MLRTEKDSPYGQMYTEVITKETVHDHVLVKTPLIYTDPSLVSTNPTQGSEPPIVVTGFGPLYPGNPNISETIMRKFYHRHDGFFEHGHENIPIVTGPDDPQPQAVVSSYRYIKTAPPESYFDDWLRQIDARLYVHLGMRTNNDFNTNPIYLEK